MTSPSDLSLDAELAALMAPGAPFEVTETRIRGHCQKIFRRAPPNLATLFDRARAFDDREFLVLGDRRLTYRMFLDQSDRLAAALLQKNYIHKGCSIAIAMKNTPEWMIAFAAIIKIGAVAALINAREPGQVLKHAVEESEAVLIIGDAPRLVRLREAGCRVPMLATDPVPGTDLLDEICGRATPQGMNTRPGPEPSLPDIHPDDTACLYFTSGTTGRAKAAAITHRALVTGTMNTQMAMTSAFAKMARALGISPEQLKQQLPQSCSLLVFPLFHTSGCSAVFLTAISMGGKLVLMDRWDADRALALVEAEKITSLGGVPTMLWDIIQAKSRADRNLCSLAAISCGGQALPLDLLEALQQAFPNAIFGAGYGMTETSGAISQANGALFLDNPASAGQKLPMVDIRIVDASGDHVTGTAEGEIWVRGATVMQGYYNRPVETAAAFENGWFKTGDIGYLDENDLLYIIGRKTDMVISGGENIYCAEVEQALASHPDIVEIAAFGLPDERLGERLAVCIYTDNKNFDEAAFMNYAKTRLAAYKLPAEIRLASAPLRRNAMGKIIKSVTGSDGSGIRQGR